MPKLLTQQETIHKLRHKNRLANAKIQSLQYTNEKLMKKVVSHEEEMRTLHMQNIALQMMIADNYENYQIWRMTLNKQEREEWLAAVKELRHNVFERWLKVTM